MPTSIPREIENQAIEWLCRLNQDNLSDKETRAFFRWLNASEIHQAAYIKAEGLWERGNILAEPDTHTHSDAQKTNSSLSWGLLTSVAATLLVATISFVLFLSPNTNPHEYQLQTAIGEITTHTLEDGSKITLNTNSRVDITISKNSRTAKLDSGEVLFDIQKDPQRPFLIETRSGKISVLGTTFTVKQTNRETYVTVISGKVKLTPTQKSKNQEIVLTKNQGSNFTPESVTEINADDAISWVNKRLKFNATPLTAVVREVNRYFSEEISIDAPSKQYITEQSTKVTGVIFLDNLDNTLDALSSFGLKANKDATNHKVVLYFSPENATQ